MITPSTLHNLRVAAHPNSAIAQLIERYDQTGGAAYDAFVVVPNKGGAVVPQFVADEVLELRAKCLRLADELADELAARATVNNIFALPAKSESTLAAEAKTRRITPMGNDAQAKLYGEVLHRMAEMKLKDPTPGPSEVDIAWFGDDDDPPEDDPDEVEIMQELIDLLTEQRDALLIKNANLAAIGFEFLQRATAAESVSANLAATLRNLSTSTVVML